MKIIDAREWLKARGARIIELRFIRFDDPMPEGAEECVGTPEKIERYADICHRHKDLAKRFVADPRIEMLDAWAKESIEKGEMTLAEHVVRAQQSIEFYEECGPSAERTKLIKVPVR